MQADLVNAGKQIPILFITAFDDERARSQALEAGSMEFLTKPLDSDRLLEAIEGCVGPA